MPFVAPAIPIGTKVKIKPSAVRTLSKEKQKILLDFIYRVVDNEWHCYALSCPIDLTFYEEDLEVICE